MFDFLPEVDIHTFPHGLAPLQHQHELSSQGGFSKAISAGLIQTKLSQVIDNSNWMHNSRFGHPAAPSLREKEREREREREIDRFPDSPVSRAS